MRGPANCSIQTHEFCYAYARATKGVSYCAPAYYADRLCDRGRAYLRHWLTRENHNNYRPQRVQAPNETQQQYYDVIKNDLRDDPYWRSYVNRPSALVQYGFTRRNPWHPNLDNTMFYL